MIDPLVLAFGHEPFCELVQALLFDLVTFAEVVAVPAPFKALSAGVERGLYTTTGEETAIHLLR